VSGGNDFGSFCVNQHVVTEGNLAFLFSRERESTPLPLPAGAHSPVYYVIIYLYACSRDIADLICRCVLTVLKFRLRYPHVNSGILR